MEISNQLLGVALLATLGALVIRRLWRGMPGRVAPLVPMTVAILIVWGFGGSASVGEVLRDGAVSGLLASGMLYVLLGLTSE